MDIAIIGLPQSGKTTLFNALTKGKAETTGGAATEMHVGVVKVPDPRLPVLAGIYHPKKLTAAEIKYWDVPGPESLARSQGIGGKFRNTLQAADAYLLVVRAFTNPAVPHPQESVDPKRDLLAMLAELTFADLEVLERVVQRQEEGLKKSKTAERPTLIRQQEAVQKVRRDIEADIPLRRQTLTESESVVMVNYGLLTGKPVIVVFNTDESGPELSFSGLGLEEKVIAGLGQVNACARLEAELALMTEDEELEFRQALGQGEPARNRVIQISYQTLGLISFLTVGEDEVRAWSIPAETQAQKAAGTIHTDFTRGFIRAEVIPYADLVRCGSTGQGRKEGVLRSEGKTYPVQDGDVINFLINV
ncbi:MAG: redox-regulated ATPase YchF [Dehalococcoidia bacterium]|nr:redox-regulated ATPase YchF [Dehalococcoidia bacterium]MSQ16790.1 redox-regulated ATPase YchF [Dehalococcoidia bacterium]